MIKKKVLLIEDEVSIRDAYQEVLLDAGFDVAVAGDGQNGLQKSLNEKWDLMLLDIMLPKKDGLEILSEMKKRDDLKARPVILLTNLGRDSIVREGYTLGASSYLIKSEITPGDIVEAVKKALPEDSRE